MRLTELAWGLPVWLVAAVVALLLTTPEWDMSAGSVVGILLAVALVFAAAGGLLWLPAARWLSDPARRAPGAGRSPSQGSASRSASSRPSSPSWFSVA